MNSIFVLLYAAYSAVSLYAHLREFPVSEHTHLTNTINHALIAYLIAEGF